MEPNRHTVWLWKNTKNLRPIRVGFGFKTEESAEEWAKHLTGPFIITHEEEEDGYLTIISHNS